MNQGGATAKKCSDNACPSECKGNCVWDYSFGNDIGCREKFTGEEDQEDPHTGKKCEELNIKTCSCSSTCTFVGDNRNGICVTTAPKNCDDINNVFMFASNDTSTIGLYSAAADACLALNYAKGTSPCKVKTLDGVPYCLDASDSNEIPCERYGRGNIEADFEIGMCPPSR